MITTTHLQNRDNKYNLVITIIPSQAGVMYKIKARLEVAAVTEPKTTIDQEIHSAVQSSNRKTSPPPCFPEKYNYTLGQDGQPKVTT